MDVIITIVKGAALFAAVALIASSCVRLYRWRRSAFLSTDADLRNLRIIHPGEKACIQAPDEPGIQYVCSGKSSETMVYGEYWYTVEGIQYCKSFFHEEDGEKLQTRIRIFYNRNHPQIMYREGAARDGIIVSAAALILGLLLLIPWLVSYFS